MSLNQLRNSRCCTKYRMKNLYNSYIKLQQSCKQHNLWLKPDSTPNYRLNKHLSFSCMLSIAKYSSIPNKKWLWLNNTHYRIARKVKNCYKVSTVLILLNMLCKLQLKPDSILHYSSSRRLQFSCMLSIAKYSSIPNKKWLWLNNTRYCIAHKVKSCYKVSTVLILLNMQCKQLLMPDSILHYNLNKRLSFSCMLSIMEYSNKLSTRLLQPSNTHYYKKYKLLSSDYMCYNL